MTAFEFGNAGAVVLTPLFKVSGAWSLRNCGPRDWLSRSEGQKRGQGCGQPRGCPGRGQPGQGDPSPREGELLFLIYIYALFFILFIYLSSLRWVFVDARGLSLVVVSGGYSLLWCAGFSSRWLLLLRSTGSRCTGFSSCGSRALECRLSSCGSRALECRLSSCGSRALECRLSSCGAWA